jgi:hypothetical protein
VHDFYGWHLDEETGDTEALPRWTFGTLEKDISRRTFRELERPGTWGGCFRASVADSGAGSGLPSGVSGGKRGVLVSGPGSGLTSGVRGGKGWVLVSGFGSGGTSGLASNLASGLDSGLTTDLAPGLTSVLLSGLASGFASGVVGWLLCFKWLVFLACSASNGVSFGKFWRKKIFTKNMKEDAKLRALKKTTSQPSFQRSHQTQQLLLCSDYLLGSSADAFISYFRPVFNFPLWSRLFRLIRKFRIFRFPASFQSFFWKPISFDEKYKKLLSEKLSSCMHGCQIFLDTTYQNGKQFTI